MYAMQMIKGDPGMEDIYRWSQNQINTPFRGRTGTFLRPFYLSCQVAVLSSLGHAKTCLTYGHA